MAPQDETTEAGYQDPRMLRDIITALRDALEKEQERRLKDVQAAQSRAASEVEQLKAAVQTLRDTMEAEGAIADERLQAARRDSAAEIQHLRDAVAAARIELEEERSRAGARLQEERAIAAAEIEETRSAARDARAELDSLAQLHAQDIRNVNKRHRGEITELNETVAALRDMLEKDKINA